MRTLISHAVAAGRMATAVLMASGCSASTGPWGSAEGKADIGAGDDAGGSASTGAGAASDPAGDDAATPGAEADGAIRPAKASGGHGGSAGASQDSPCSGCMVRTPDSYNPAIPYPLVIALHGDEGNPQPLYNNISDLAVAAGMIILAPQCPANEGCSNGSWWQWYESSAHDPAWLVNQIQAVEGLYNVDLTRVYICGASGGASYLGYWAPTHSTLIGAAAYVIGGVQYVNTCPTCKYGVYFLEGSEDFMLQYSVPLRDWYQSCDTPGLVWDEHPGVGHDALTLFSKFSASSDATKVFNWMLTYRTCGK